MKKYIYSLALCLCVSGSLYAGNGEKYIGISGGYSLLRAIDVRLSYEMESRYHGSHERFSEFYDSYEKGDWRYLRSRNFMTATKKGTGSTCRNTVAVMPTNFPFTEAKTPLSRCVWVRL